MKHTRFLKEFLLSLAGLLLVIFVAEAQLKIGTSSGSQEPAKEDTTKPAPRVATKPYASVVNKNFTSKWGLFAVHQFRDKIYFEIPDSILKQDIMIINRLVRVPAGHGMYAGEALDERTIWFEKGPDSTIQIRYDLLINEADSSSAIYKAVIKSSENPIVASFPVMAYGKGSAVIDVSKFLKEKNFINGIHASTALAQNANVGGMKDFYIESIRVYPVNVEISISKTMPSSSKLLPPGTPATLETNTSFIALPKVPMQRRYFDPRVGYFADFFYEFGDAQQKTKLRQFIMRWRMEPKPEDRDKWKRGELVEPQKPIVIYIDPATPKQWRSYLIAGVNDWQVAFGQAGFKNAIIGKEWPEGDTSMNMEDARYSFVRYLPSEIPNAYGPNVHDPRSGEIIQTHIGWYHNVMELLSNWYMTQASAVDPQARTPILNEKLMGELIRFVSSHEVGHTLGLRHNFGSSSRTPVDSLRSKTYLDKFGHTASIMDYARFNYVAQPEDGLTQQQLFPRIGDYDKWAIEWGYKYVAAPDADADNKIVRTWIKERLKNPRLWFGDGETKRFDPQCQTEDLGDDAIIASRYGIKNLQRILPNLPQWTFEEGGLNENLANMYKQVQNQFTRYMLHVLKNISGVNHVFRSEEEGGPLYEVVPKGKQKSALTFFDEQVFTTPMWLLDKNVVSRVTLPAGQNYVEEIQVRMLNTLLDIGMVTKLQANVQQFGNNAFPVEEYIATIHKSIWKEILGTGPVKMDAYRRNLQKTYFGAMTEIIMSKDPVYTETEASSIIRADMFLLKTEIDKAILRSTEPLTLYHLKDIQERFKTAFNSKL